MFYRQIQRSKTIWNNAEFATFLTMMLVSKQPKEFVLVALSFYGISALELEQCSEDQPSSSYMLLPPTIVAYYRYLFPPRCVSTLVIGLDFQYPGQWPVPMGLDFQNTDHCIRLPPPWPRD